MAQGDDQLARPWSRHSKGSSAYLRSHPADKPQRKRDQKAEEHSSAEVEEKKRKFREFLKMTQSGNKKQSWNDQFESFMEGAPPAKT